MQPEKAAKKVVRRNLPRDVWQRVGSYLTIEELLRMFNDWTENEEAALGFAHSIPGLSSRYQIVRAYLSVLLNLRQMNRINYAIALYAEKRPYCPVYVSECWIDYYLLGDRHDAYYWNWSPDMDWHDLLRDAECAWSRVWPRYGDHPRDWRSAKRLKAMRCQAALWLRERLLNS